MAWKGTRPTAFVRTIERAITQRQKDIAAYALSRLILGSPVDSGAYRGNHRVTINGRTYEFDSDKTDAGGLATLNEGLQILGTISGAFNEVVIQNNAPYAQRLEDGGSAQGSGGNYYAIAFNSTVERFR